MNDLPAPMTPTDCDLRDFPYMPLDVLRLRDSDLAAIEDAEAFRAAVLSWCVSWHQVPAASLPDDDAALCRLLGYGRDLKTWRRVRDAGGLRGWVKCSDGRLYHRVVSEKATEAVTARRRQRDRTDAARRARQSQAPPTPVTERIPSVTDNATDNVTRSKGREGKGEEGIEEPPYPHGGADAPMGDEEGIQSGRKAPFGRGLRADGTSPRAVAAAVKATAAALKATEIEEKAEAHPLWPACRGRVPAATFAGTIGLCEYRNGADPPVLIAPSRFLRDHIRAEFGRHLERHDARIRVEFAAAADAQAAPVVDAQAESVA